jgi:hypothetical protein
MKKIVKEKDEEIYIYELFHDKTPEQVCMSLQAIATNVERDVLQLDKTVKFQVLESDNSYGDVAAVFLVTYREETNAEYEKRIARYITNDILRRGGK